MPDFRPHSPGKYYYQCTDCDLIWSQRGKPPYQLCIACDSLFVRYLGEYDAASKNAKRSTASQREKDEKNMPEIKFTQEDLLERTQLSPGWRTLICKSIDEGPGKNDPSSIVYSCVFSIDAGSEKGVPIRHWFSEKAMGRIVDYIKCFVPQGKLEPGKVYELAQTIGLQVDGYCQYDLGQGYNTIKDWRPAVKGAVKGDASKGK